MKRQQVARLLFAIMIVVGMVGCVRASTIPIDPLSGGVPTLAPILERVTPAVVNISVVSRSPAVDNPLLRDPFFRRFFNIPEGMPEERTQVSAGSGVIVDSARGYVLTNHHVVANGLEIFVTLKDRRRLKAELVGSDEATDIALLHIDADNLTALPFGDSNALQVGDFVAVGRVAVADPIRWVEPMPSLPACRDSAPLDAYEASYFAASARISSLRARDIGIGRRSGALVFYSGGDLKTGVSIRGSKTEAGLNTNYARLMAESLGGGGHDMASGANWGSYTELTKLIAEITEDWGKKDG